MEPLSRSAQDLYFNNTISQLFNDEKPDQILFSYLENDICIGYGGLVHINWDDRHAELSFIMDTQLEASAFAEHWTNYIQLICEVAFKEIGLHKIFTYAYDIRSNLYPILEEQGFSLEARLTDHKLIENNYVDVVIHSRLNKGNYLRNVSDADLDITFRWASDPIVRAYAFNKKKISREEHTTWYINKLSDPQCEFFILVDKGRCLGSIRFDITKDNEAIISYLIDSEHHGKGLGKEIIIKGIERLLSRRPEVSKISGEVDYENKASIHIFQTLGFVESESDGHLKYTLITGDENRK